LIYERPHLAPTPSPVFIALGIPAGVDVANMAEVDGGDGAVEVVGGRRLN